MKRLLIVLVLTLVSCVLIAVAIAPKGADPSGGKVAFATVQGVMRERCLPCHSAQPTQPGFAQPPKGVVLETPEQMTAWSERIIARVVETQTMPLGNLTGMTDDERTRLGAWAYQQRKR